MLASTTILLVEDHFDTAEAMQRALESRGYIVSIAAGYGDAMRLTRALRYDLVLCDIRLPDGNGCNLVAELREVYPIRAIAVTAAGMPEDVALCRDADVNAFLLKPVRLDALLETIEFVIVGVVGLFPDGQAQVPAYR